MGLSWVRLCRLSTYAEEWDINSSGALNVTDWTRKVKRSGTRIVRSKGAPCQLEEGNREGINERDKNRRGKKLT
jgi:hypothetical protein